MNEVTAGNRNWLISSYDRANTYRECVMHDTLCYVLVVCICFSSSLLATLITTILKMRNLRYREVSKVAAVAQLMMVMVFIWVSTVLDFPVPCRL